MAEVISVERAGITSITLKLSREEAETLNSLLYFGLAAESNTSTKLLQNLRRILQESGVELAKLRVNVFQIIDF